MNMTWAQSGQSISTSLDARTAPRHRWYWVKEGFSPSLVRTAIEMEKCTLSDLVVDPFCGSGTVPLEAARCQVRAAGAEVNPFLAFAAQAKTLSPKGCLVSAWHERARKAIYEATYSPLIGFSTFAKTRQKRGLFNQEVLKGFRGAWQSLEPAPDAVKALLRLCLMRAVLDCANFIRDGKALRYSETRIQHRFGRAELEEEFSSRVDDAVKDMAIDQGVAHPPPVELTDSRVRLSDQFRGFRLCVTSPPYLNSFDYTDVYRPELFLGGFVRTAQELRELRHRTVRSHVQASWSPPTESDFGPLFAECLKAVRSRHANLWNQRIPEMIQAYFEDLRVVLRKLHGLARDDAVVWLVVSTSAYAGVQVPVDLILADIGTQVGWSLREVCVLRHLRSSGQHRRQLSATERENVFPLRESLIILDANAKGT